MKHIVTLTVLLLIACNGKPKVTTDPAYVKLIQDWHDARIKRLPSENSWLNLAGLFWLKEGANKFGSSKENDIVFPANAPSYCGIFHLKNGEVTLEPARGVEILQNGKPIKAMRLFSDADSNTTFLRLGALKWNIIKRGDKMGIRLRDLESPLLKSFNGIDMYPIDAHWRVEAKLEPYNPPKVIAVPTILNTIDSMPSPGALVFLVDGETCRIDPVIEEPGASEWFIIFGDKTNGSETYGGGRFIYIPSADSTGKTVIDFNKAYNPPCVFTDYATCPLPPAQNKLSIAVVAGEKKYGNHSIQ